MPGDDALDDPVTLQYVDTSALVRCYFPDEPDHVELRESLLESADPVVSSELTRLELASAIHAAHRAGRLVEPTELMGTIESDYQVGGPVSLLRLEPEGVFDRAAELVVRFPLRALDAIHLAVATTTAADLAADEPVTLVTRDHRQRAAAEALGLAVE